MWEVVSPSTIIRQIEEENVAIEVTLDPTRIKNAGAIVDLLARF